MLLYGRRHHNKGRTFPGGLLSTMCGFSGRMFGLYSYVGLEINRGEANFDEIVKFD